MLEHIALHVQKPLLENSDVMEHIITCQMGFYGTLSVMIQSQIQTSLTDLKVQLTEVLQSSTLHEL